MFQSSATSTAVFRGACHHTTDTWHPHKCDSVSEKVFIQHVMNTAFSTSGRIIVKSVMVFVALFNIATYCFHNNNILNRRYFLQLTNT